LSGIDFKISFKGNLSEYLKSNRKRNLVTLFPFLLFSLSRWITNRANCERGPREKEKERKRLLTGDPLEYMDSVGIPVAAVLGGDATQPKCQVDNGSKTLRSTRKRKEA